MKLILKQDVSGLGESGDVVEVKDGYGRNYLVPRGLAMRWTQGGEKQIDQMRRARSAREIRDLDHAQEVRDQLEALDVKLAARAHDGGQLFGSVKAKDIVAAIRAAGGPPLDKALVELPPSVKQVGVVKAAIRLHPGVTASVPVTIEAA